LHRQSVGARTSGAAFPLTASAFAIAWMRSSASTPARRLLRTNTECAGPASSDACSARAKQASVRDRSALSKVVRSGRRRRSCADAPFSWAERSSRAIATHPATRQSTRLVVTGVGCTASRARWSVSGVLGQRMLGARGDWPTAQDRPREHAGARRGHPGDRVPHRAGRRSLEGLLCGGARWPGRAGGEPLHRHACQQLDHHEPGRRTDPGQAGHLGCSLRGVEARSPASST
jgi:hypothetical protein